MTTTLPYDRVRDELDARDWVPSAPGPWDTPGLDVQGHRGARGEVVESTLAGFVRAAEEGCRSVELDVQLSRDGVPVVWHDPVLLPSRCVAAPELMGRRIDELTVDQLSTVQVGVVRDPHMPHQELVPGASMLTLAALARTMGAIYPDLWLTVEIKCDPRDPADVAGRRRLIEATVQTLHDTGRAERAIIHSFDWSVLTLTRETDDSMTRSALAVVGGTYLPDSPWTGGVDARRHGTDLAAAAAEAGAHMLSPWFGGVQRVGGAGPIGMLPQLPQVVERAHGLGLAVVPWTVNHPEDLRAVIEADVDGLVTDYPARAVEVAVECGALLAEPTSDDEPALAQGRSLTIHDDLD